MKYGRHQTVAYQLPKRSSVLKSKISPKKKRFDFIPKAVQSVKQRIVANVMDIAYFLTKYLSGHTDVLLKSIPRSTSFATSRKYVKGGKQLFIVSVPDWSDYQLPSVDEFSRYRIFRHGVYHEAMHVKYTPPDLFGISGKDGFVHDVVNIIEDRRIEDLGQQEWRGYIPERIFVQAYAYSVRPNTEKLYKFDRDHGVYEAFLQKLLIGKIKGKLPQEELEKIEKAEKMVLDSFKEINKPNLKGYERASEIHRLAKEVINILDIKVPPPQPQTKSSWDDTFDPFWVEKQNKHKPIEEFEKEKAEYFKEAAKKTESKEKGEEAKPGEVTKEDVEQAQKGSVDVHNEFDIVQKGAGLPKELTHWAKSVAFGNTYDYRDSKFITKMNTALRHWKTGYVEYAKEHGAKLSVRQYIREQEKPFIHRIKMSARGRKILVLADFSSSMADRQEEYKKALLSSMEVLDSIGTKTAFFTFACDPASGYGFFSIKQFEEPKWTSTHSSKVAALTADYPSTPTSSAYKQLMDYVKKHKPDVFITVTDGVPADPDETEEAIKKLRKMTRMVAFGIAYDKPDMVTINNALKSFSYHKQFVVSDVYDIPPRLVKLIAPT